MDDGRQTSDQSKKTDEKPGLLESKASAGNGFSSEISMECFDHRVDSLKSLKGPLKRQEHINHERPEIHQSQTGASRSIAQEVKDVKFTLSCINDLSFVFTCPTGGGLGAVILTGGFGLGLGATGGAGLEAFGGRAGGFGPRIGGFGETGGRGG